MARLIPRRGAYISHESCKINYNDIRKFILFILFFIILIKKNLTYIFDKFP